MLVFSTAIATSCMMGVPSLPLLALPSSTAFGWLATLVGMGMIGLAFTSYRFMLGYFLLGMLAWLGVEALQWLVSLVWPQVVDTQRYVLAMALALVPLMLFLYSRPLLGLWTALWPKNQPTTPSRRVAGQRTFILDKDTDYHQSFIRHSSVTDR